MIDRNGNVFCSWCGDPVHPDRWHLDMCSNKCAADLNADDRRRCREALADFNKNGGTSLEDVKRELELE